jgi:hypothetical protein
MGVWGGYLIDENTPYREYLTKRRVRNGIDPKIEVSS